MKALKFLYSVPEEHPARRVDLTELFSRGIALRGHHIVWHMPPSGPRRGGQLRSGPHEQILLNTRLAGASRLILFVNSVLSMLHGARLLWLPALGRYDFIQVRDGTFTGLTGLFGARLARSPFFYWMSFPYADAEVFRSSDRSLGLTRTKRTLLSVKGRLSQLLLYRYVLPRADHVFVQSDRMKQDLLARGIAAQKMTPVPMAIAWRTVSQATIVPADDPWLRGRAPIVYVGTLVRARKMDFLIDVLKHVRRECPEAMLVMVGDAPAADMAILEAAAAEDGVRGHVRFTGLQAMEAAWRYIKAARVCVSVFRPSPMLDSTSPTKVVEYLALGRPVVANEHPDQTKVLSESGAGLAVPYDVAAFSDAVVSLLRDPARAEAMGRSGPDYVKRFRTYENLVPWLESVYQGLLSQRAGQ